MIALLKTTLKVHMLHKIFKRLKCAVNSTYVFNSKPVNNAFTDSYCRESSPKRIDSKLLRLESINKIHLGELTLLKCQTCLVVT